jgi:putative tryptophan/tyrosine transport system substrate-binding protein
VALLWNPVPAGAATYRTAVESAAGTLGVTLQPFDVRGREDLEPAFAAMVRNGANALLVLPDPLLYSARSQVALLAARNRLPAVYGQREYVEVGGLMSYGPNLADQYRRAAVYVDKILKGAKPGDLPVEQTAKFELVINLKSAHALALTIPQPLRLRADQIIE